MQQLIGYHATKLKNIDSILKNGFKPSVSTTSRTHWLGKGIYLYEDLYYATEWNYVSLNELDRNYENLQNKCGIIIVKLDTENFSLLDLNSGIGYDAYNKIVDSIKKLCSEKEKENLKNNGDIKAIKIIEKIENKLGIKLFSRFDIICALYPKNVFKKQINYKGDFFVGIQKQICVKNEQAIIEKARYEYTDNQLETIYNLILQNRRNMK